MTEKNLGSAQANFQAAVEGDDAELLMSGDEGDITAETLGGEGKRSRTTRTVASDEESDEDAGDSDEVDEETEEDETSQQPTSKRETGYNKDQVQKIVQTRVGTLTKKIGKLESYKTAVDKICEVTGLDFDKLVSRLSGMTDAEQAQILGVPVDQIKETRAIRTQVSQEKGKNQTLTRQIDEMSLKADPKYHDYDLYKEEIDDILDENPKLTLKQAYTLAKGDTAVTAAARDAEQRVVARQVNSQKKGVVKPMGVGTTSTQTKIDPMVISAAKKIGMDPVEYLKYQQIDNIDAYRNSKAKKK